MATVDTVTILYWVPVPLIIPGSPLSLLTLSGFFVAGIVVLALMANGLRRARSSFGVMPAYLSALGVFLFAFVLPYAYATG